MYETVSLLIPVSKDISSNTQAVVKPFQWPVKMIYHSQFIIKIYHQKIQPTDNLFQYQ